MQITGRKNIRKMSHRFHKQENPHICEDFFMKKARQANCLSYSVPSKDKYGVVLQAGGELQAVRKALLFPLKKGDPLCFLPAYVPKTFVLKSKQAFDAAKSFYIVHFVRRYERK